MNVYLAGAIEAAPDDGRVWREEITKFLKNELGYAVHDPSRQEVTVLTPAEHDQFRAWRRTDFPRFQEVIHRIIKHDLKQILFNTDFIICKWDEYVRDGGGTQGELTLAFLHNIPVYLVTDLPVEKISSWILGCVTEIFDNFQALKSTLRSRNIPRKPVLGKD